MLVPQVARADSLPQPSLQDMQIAGRVLGFQEMPPSGPLDVAVLYDSASAASRREAAAIVALLGSGLGVGSLVLRPHLVDQTRLGSLDGVGAVFATTSLDEALLKTSLGQHKIPCLTLHLEQVQRGSCTVAIRSVPSVSIIVSDANANTAGVRFATAFRMMVREL